MENKKQNNESSCCKKNTDSKGLLKGVLFGIVPHAGCIAFILFSVLGMTFAASLFKPLLAKTYIFQAMILLSFIFATISAFFYLRKNGGIKTAFNHKGYLSILYGTTIGISLILYFVIFPAIAGVSASSINTNVNQDSIINLKVAIPCEGHASLITSELKTINGVGNIEFSSPNIFRVSFDSKLTSKQEILSLNIFKEYKATEI